MQIKILDSWLREHLDTKATAKQISETLSLTSASVERLEKVGTDFLYDVEITTNRPDLMSVTGLAREAATALSAEGIPAKFISKKISQPKVIKTDFPVKIKSDPNLTHRICAAVLSVHIAKSPQVIKDRLEGSDIRSLNNVVDVTNYVMRELGHPVHVFDLDRLGSLEMEIRSAVKGEKITTLDKKDYTLLGGEIVADNGKGEIIDLLGIMGLSNSIIQDSTKNVLLFIDNLDKIKVRKASMELGIRTEAAVLNEKGVDPELSYRALLRGIELLKETAEGELTSSILDIYPHPKKQKTIQVKTEKIHQVIGVTIPEKKISEILTGLEFTVKNAGGVFSVTPPSFRSEDIEIPEDVIEEVARIYGYHKLPSILPVIDTAAPVNRAQDPFYWEKKIKYALKYWGFTEVYTYSFVSEEMLEVSSADAVKIANPLGADMTYLRTTLIPSLLEAVRENKNFEEVRLFELANVYYKKKESLPDEVMALAAIVKKENVSFLEVKGIVEAILLEFGINQYEFRKSETSTADVFVANGKAGEIEQLDRNSINFELNFDFLVKHASSKKIFTPIPKFPSAVEDLRIIIDRDISYHQIVTLIKKTDPRIISVTLLDTFEDKKTFRITYQSPEKSLTNLEISSIREKIIHRLKTDLKAEIA